MEEQHLAVTSAQRHRDDGYFLVEVLLALAVLAFVLLAATPQFIRASQQNAGASDLTFATTMAEDKAEELKRAPYAALGGGSDVVRLRSLDFDRVWTVQTGVPFANMRTVTVTVTSRRLKGFGGNHATTLQFVRVPTTW